MEKVLEADKDNQGEEEAERVKMETFEKFTDFRKFDNFSDFVKARTRLKLEYGSEEVAMGLVNSAAASNS